MRDEYKASVQFVPGLSDSPVNRGGFSVTEQALVDLATPLEHYGTVTEALAAIAKARQFQLTLWRSVGAPDAGGRSAEEWQLLLHHYITELDKVYAESDGSTPAGRERYARSAALVANLAFWLVQATVGPANADKRNTVTVVDAIPGCLFHGAPDLCQSHLVENAGGGFQVVHPAN